MKVLLSDDVLINKYGFSYLDTNSKYLIRYINDNYDSENYETYRTLYVDRYTRKIFAYNDMWDKDIPMRNKYIDDLLKDNAIKKQKKSIERTIPMF